MTAKRPTLFLSGEGLTYEDVVRVARGEDGVYPFVAIEKDVRTLVIEMRKKIEDKIAIADEARKLIDEKNEEIKKANEEKEIKDKQSFEIIDAKYLMYGVNTGCGSNKHNVISEKDLLSYQDKYIKTHACGTGPPLPKEVVRAMMLIRVNSLLVGCSGLTIELLDKILDFLNFDVIPVIPSYGSVGASGDLVPLAHLGAALIGLEFAEVELKGKIVSAATLKNNGVEPHVLQAKEAMGLTNGASMMLACACLAYHDTLYLYQLSNVNLCLGMESIRGELEAFDPRLAGARPHPGQIATGLAVQRLLRGSTLVSDDHKDAQRECLEKHTKENHTCVEACGNPRVQDAYSTRCALQVHGAVLDALGHFKSTIDVELNSATDNPLIFELEDGDIQVLSGGNFHGEPLAYVLDYLAIAITGGISNISNSRLYRLINQELSFGLPQDLVGADLKKEKDNTGFMIAQYMVASRVTASKCLSMPASVDSIMTSGHQEDYVSMGAHSALKLREVIENAQIVLSVELLATCQAVDLCLKYLPGNDWKVGKGTYPAYKFVRKQLGINLMEHDKPIKPKIDKVVAAVKEHKLPC